MAPSCDTSIKTDGASSDIIPGPAEKFLHSSGVGICNHGHTARRQGDRRRGSLQQAGHPFEVATPSAVRPRHL